MATTGTVRLWLDAEGYGVIDSPETPGGCWTHFSAVVVDGYRTLGPGQTVTLEWEVARQDGYDYRAVRTWPADQRPAELALNEPDAATAYGSTLTITSDSPVDRGGER